MPAQERDGGGGGGAIRLRGRNRNVVPRGVLSLQNEARRRVFMHRLWFCIVGMLETGRKTLATRFNALQDEVLNVVTQNCYRFPINLDTRPAVNHTGYVHVGILIDPSPYPLGLEELYLASHLRAIIFLFDVNRVVTFNAVGDFFSNYKDNRDENMVPSIMVGNKIDVRDRPRNPDEDEDDNAPRTVPTAGGKELAREKGAVGYYECSALRNTGVEPILDAILQLIMR